MIEYVSGTIKSLDKGELVLAVGPLGLSIQVPMSMQGSIDQAITLYMQLYWNQENGPTLYGFINQSEKRLFMFITSCSGIGPKIALSVLSDLGVEAFLAAIQTGDDKALSIVNGIGPKKAEQIVVQLKHKVAQLIKSGVMLTGATVIKWHEITQVLESLHYSRNEISTAMQYLHSEYGDASVSFDGLIRHALSFLAKKS